MSEQFAVSLLRFDSEIDELIRNAMTCQSIDALDVGDGDIQMLDMIHS